MDRSHLRVLIVDDEPGYRDMYVYLMEPRGITVDSAANGVEALEKVKKMSYDLIFMDIHMPVMGGPEAVRLIREIRPDQKIYIFSSSSDPTCSQEERALTYGANECLYKPVELDVLERILGQAANGSA